jgi:alpha-tubulin suppressor-like RCC1 family protein
LSNNTPFHASITISLVSITSHILRQSGRGVNGQFVRKWGPVIREALDSAIRASCLFLVIAASGCSLLIDTGSLSNDDAGPIDDADVPDAVPPCEPQPEVKDIAVGRNHVCVLLATEDMWCWGRNEDGQLGRGTARHDALPVKIESALSGQPMSGIRAGIDHTCAWTTEGAAYCWGDGNNGQLGNSGNGNVESPTPASEFTEAVVDMSLGDDFTCDITVNSSSVRELYCLGDNSYGQTGAAPPATQRTQVLVPITQPQNVAAGSQFACAIAGDGKVYCWGRNKDGQLGSLAQASTETPVEIPGVVNAKALAAGNDHICAITGTEGEVWCWGDGGDGQLGSGTGPGPVADGLMGATEIVVGDDFSCALGAGGQLFCWGDGDRGNLGNGTFDSLLSPLPTRQGLPNLELVAAGGFTMCGVADGRFECWGDNSHGQLTDTPVPISEPAPEMYGGGRRFKALSASGNNHACGLDLDDATAWCWGSNDSHQFGSGVSHYRGSSTPTPVSTDAFSQIDVGFDHTCGLVGGEVKCWGGNGQGQIGDGTRSQRATPYTVPLPGITDIGVGGRRSCAVSPAGVACWGQFPEDGRNAVDPEIKLGPWTAAVTNISVGDEHVCVIAGLKLYCWGQNDDGQLGNGTTTDSSTPVSIIVGTGDEDIEEVFLGSSNTCALGVNQKLYCWGEGADGRSGQSSNAPVLTPTEVTALPAPVAAAAVSFHTCAIAGSERETWCWGENFQGELGRDDATSKGPMKIENRNDLLGVTTSLETTCVLETNGRPWCWGADTHGQRLSERTLYSPTAIDITDRLCE